MITPRDFNREMERFAQYGDIEMAHYAMDELMCSVLKEQGYGEGIAVFERQQKWYA